jgi:Cdc6-like AAA superfamily ATPase
MASLSFDKTIDSDAIAVVRGGDYDGQILYLHQAEHKPTNLLPKREINALKYQKELKEFKPNERIRIINRLQEALNKDLEADALVGETDAIKSIYRKIKEEKHEDKSVELPSDSTFHPIPSPDPKKRQVWYVAGQSGSGKSYFARGIAESYKKLYPDRDVYLISKLNEDETLDKSKIAKPNRISLDSLVNDPPELDEFKDCLVIFDDFDTLDKPYDKVVHKLIEDLCIMGRHTNTSMLILSHYLTNYKKTRLILGEANFLVVYPLATSFKALKYVCEHYGGLDKEQIHQMKKLGRWVMIHKNYPVYVLSAHSAFMPHA